MTYTLLHIDQPVLQFEQFNRGFPLLHLPFLLPCPLRALAQYILGTLGVGRLLFLPLPQGLQGLFHLRGKEVLGYDYQNEHDPKSEIGEAN